MVSFPYAFMKVDIERWLSHSSFHERALIKENKKKRWLVMKEHKKDGSHSKPERGRDRGSLEKERDSRSHLATRVSVKERRHTWM